MNMNVLWRLRPCLPSEIPPGRHDYFIACAIDALDDHFWLCRLFSVSASVTKYRVDSATPASLGSRDSPTYHSPLILAFWQLPVYNASVQLNIFQDLLPHLSPLSLARHALGLAAILLVGLIAQQILRLVSRSIKHHLTDSGEGTRKERLVRANSLATVVSTSLSVVIWLIILLSALEQVGINIGPFLASAGILGLAVSFGAQDLVKDVIAGLFFLLENQFNAGDTISINDKKGTVASMSLRTIMLKDQETGTLYMVRNSMVGMIVRYPDDTPDKHEKS